jgi:hypothetical protein
MLMRSTSFGPTYRLASSPEVGPGATVGTLKLGYPLLLYKDEEPTWLSLSHEEKVLRMGPGHGSPQSQAAILGPQQPKSTTWAGPEPPRVQRRCYIPRHQQWSEPPWKGAKPPDIQSGPLGLVPDPQAYSPDPRVGLGPPRVQAGPLE